MSNNVISIVDRLNEIKEVEGKLGIIKEIIAIFDEQSAEDGVMDNGYVPYSETVDRVEETIHSMLTLLRPDLVPMFKEVFVRE